MGYKKFEFRVVFIVDDSVQSVMDDIKDMEKSILTGESQRELLSNPGYTSVNCTLKELNKTK